MQGGCVDDNRVNNWLFLFPDNLVKSVINKKPLFIIVENIYAKL